MMSTDAPLAGISVLVTRPASQAEELCARLEQLGASAIRLPTLLIGPPRPTPGLEAALAAVPVADWAVFVSRNAVDYGLRLLGERGLRLGAQVRLATVGAGTARALREHGYKVTCQPNVGFNSEALLEMPEFSVGADDRVLIFRGEGGRALLGDALRERGAKVRYAEVYRREQPRVDVRVALTQWRLSERRWVVVTSKEGLVNLLQMVGAAADEVQRAGLVTVSERIAAAARRYGWRGPVRIAEEPGDGGLIRTLAVVTGEPH